MAASSDSSVIEKVLEPQRFELGDETYIVVLGVALAVSLIGMVTLFLLVRRFGKADGRIGTTEFLLGFPLAIGAFILPSILYAVMFGGIEQQDPLVLGLLQAFVALGAMGFLAMHPWRTDRDPPSEWAVLRPRQLIWIPLIWLLAFPVMQAAMFAGVAISELTSTPIQQQEVITRLRGDSSPGWIIGWYVMAVLAAPLMEEFVFRVVLFGGTRRVLSDWFARAGVPRDKPEGAPGWLEPSGIMALVVSVGLFVLAHGIWDWKVGILPLTVLSVLLTLVYAHTRNIWPGVILHATHNAFVVTMHFFVLM